MTDDSAPALTHCVYCGAYLPKERKKTGAGRNQEHAVGRQFFASPRPADLNKVVVPSCRGCNEKDKPDEDYFRSVLLGLSDAALSPTGQKIREQVGDRAFQEDKGLRARAAGRLERVTLRTPTGLVLPERYAQSVDWDAVERVLAKWTRGLHWKEYGQRLPADVTFAMAMRPVAKLNDGFHFEGFTLGSGRWDGTFEFWHSTNPTDPLQTRWSYKVWDRLGFVVVTNHTLGIVPDLAILSDEYPGCVAERATPMQPGASRVVAADIRDNRRRSF